MNKIIILDTNILVHIFEKLYVENKTAFNKILELMLLEYHACWIPKTVKTEFLRGKKYQTLYKRLKKAQEKYKMQLCPITVGINEIRLLIKSDDQDLGEGDAILQAKKALDKTEYINCSIEFCTKDKKAKKLAENMEINIVSYETFLERTNEVEL